MEAIDAKLDDLEQRSLLLQEEIRRLKTQRNAHAPISKLPDEVLLEIFMVMMALFSFEAWHEVAHVCHRWRNVAVGAPMLWINPPTRQYHLTMLMLERSKESKLTIYLDGSTSTQTAQAIFNCIGRIESLELDEGDDEDDEDPYEFFLQRTLLPASTQEATSLKSLKLTGSAEDSWNIQPMMQFLRPMAQLNDLLLAHVLFEWNVLPLNNLTRLSLEDVFSFAPISMQQLIETLRQMPLLEELNLPFSSSILLPHPLPSMTEARLTLPFLRLVNLTDSHPARLVDFFAHTAFPRLRGLVIEVVDPHGDLNFINNYYSSFIQATASLVKNGAFGTFERASFGFCSFGLSMLDVEDDSPDIVFDMPDDGEEESDTGAQILLDLFELCRPNFSKLLHLTMSSVLTEAEYMRLFGGPCLSYLQKITISNAKILFTLSSILAVPLHDDPSELVDVPFSNLQSISCDGVRFTNSSVLDAFIDCLMSRHEYGYPLHDLTLDYCSNMTSKQLTRLKEAVVNLKNTHSMTSSG